MTNPIETKHELIRQFNVEYGDIPCRSIIQNPWDAGDMPDKVDFLLDKLVELTIEIENLKYKD